MPASRRLRLLSTLVVLTLFCAALGWRNWHLPMNEETIIRVIVKDYRSSTQRPAKVFNRINGRISSPFADEEATVVSQKQEGTSRPISAAILKRLQQSYPKSRLFNFPAAQKSSECIFSFEEIRIDNRFRAECVVAYTLKAPDNSAPADYRETFTLRRSPINFQESGWQIAEASSNDQSQIPQVCPGCIP